MSSIREKIVAGDFVRIVCVGDMQTSQPFVKPTWTDWLQRALWESGDVQTAWRRQIINAGIDRATPKHLSSYYTRYIGQYKPDAVLLSFGISPMYPSFDQKAFSAELDSVLDTANNEGVQVALWSPYPLLSGEKREVTLTLGALFKQKAIERSLHFIDLYRDFDDVELTKIFTSTVVVPNELFQLEIGAPDIVSLNAIGHYIVAKRLATDWLGVVLPDTDTGSFTTPNLASVRKWG